MSWLKQILVPVDLSRCSAAALRYACFLADCYEAAVDVLHVLEPRRHPWSAVTGRSADLHQRARRRRTAIRQELLHIGSPAAERARIMFAAGDPVEEILQRCNQGYELIVMGRYGKRHERGRKMGRVVQHIVAVSDLTVLPVQEDVQIPFLVAPQPAVQSY